MGAFFHRNEHDVGDTETANQNRKDTDKTACRINDAKHRIQLSGDNGGFIERKIVFFLRTETADRPHHATQFAFGLLERNVGKRTHHNVRISTADIDDVAAEIERYQYRIIHRHIEYHALTLLLKDADNGDLAPQHFDRLADRTGSARDKPFCDGCPDYGHVAPPVYH